MCSEAMKSDDVLGALSRGKRRLATWHYINRSHGGYDTTDCGSRGLASCDSARSGQSAGCNIGTDVTMHPELVPRLDCNWTLWFKRSPCILEKGLLTVILVICQESVKLPTYQRNLMQRNTWRCGRKWHRTWRTTFNFHMNSTAVTWPKTVPNEDIYYKWDFKYRKKGHQRETEYSLLFSTTYRWPIMLA